MEEKIILVNEHDEEIGSCPKLEAHQKGLLHRAFSVFIFNGDQLLMQRRAMTKYHSGGLWANSCCSHPRVGEPLQDAVSRRLLEECGIQTSLYEAGSFIYCSPVGNSLIEYELDHVFVGIYDGFILRNPEEADCMEFQLIAEIQQNLTSHPERYSCWFPQALDIALRYKKDDPD